MLKHSKLAAVGLYLFASTALLVTGPISGKVLAVDTPTPTIASTDPTVSTPQGNPRLDMGLSVSPVKFIFDGNPGESLKGQLTYYNATGSDLTIYLYTRNFKSDNNSGSPQFVEEDLPFESSAKDWIKFDSSKFVVKRVEPKNTNAYVLNFSIDIPANAEAGGHYAAIMATINDPAKKLEPQKGNIAFSADTGALILLNVKGNVSRNLVLEKFVTIDPFSKDQNETWLYEWMPAKFLTNLQNTGNSHAFPLGNIIVYQGTTEVQKLVFNDAESAILKDSKRSFTTTMDSGWAYLEAATETVDGKSTTKTNANGDTETKLSFNWEKFSKQFYGPYKAKLLLVYEDNGQMKSLTSEKDFWVLPWKVILVVVGVIAAYALIRFKPGKKK